MSDTEQLIGAGALAKVFSDRIHRETNGGLTIDFGTINKNLSLTTNTFRVPIKRGSYSVCKPLSGSGGISLKAGMRVLVVWVQNEAVVVGVIQRS